MKYTKSHHYQVILLFILEIFLIYLGHKTNEQRMFTNYLFVSDKTKIEMCLSAYQFCQPDVILPENMLDEIWSSSWRLKLFYNKYSREVR